MNEINNSSYKPIPLKDFKAKSEEEMELISKNHLLNMKSRHTIRDFSNKKSINMKNPFISPETPIAQSHPDSFVHLHLHTLFLHFVISLLTLFNAPIN